MNKKYFVILYENELEQLDSAAQIAVYQAIKSYSANGKNEVSLGSRDIAMRAKVSHVYALKVVTELTLKGLISITGSKGVVGGRINNYKILSVNTVNTLDVSVNTVNTRKNKVLTTGRKALTAHAQKSDNIKSNIYTSSEGFEKLEELFKLFNTLFETRLSPNKKVLTNFNYWSKSYSLQQMERALQIAKTDRFWSTVIDPVKLLRRKDQEGNPVDRIGELLRKGNAVVDEPIVGDDWLKGGQR